MTKSWSAERLLELSRSYQRSQPILAAAELGVFAVLDGTPRTAAEAAGCLGTDPRGTGVLLDALAALGVLDKSDGRFTLPASLAPLVAADGESSVLAMVRHQATCAHRWDRLAETVRTGSPSSAWGHAPWSETEQRAFILAMHAIGRELAGPLMAELHPGRFRRALDVGGGSGTYTIALLRAAPDLRVTLFDLPSVVEMARQRLDDSGLADRVDLVAGDFYRDPLPAGHDLVLLSAIIHQNGPDQNRVLYEKCRAALEPGGVLVIRDVLMEDSHTEPPGGALFAVNMLVSTENGGTYSLAEIRADLEVAGFTDVEILRHGDWMDSLVTARRSG